MNEKENIEAKFLICKSGDLLLARRSQRLRRAGGGYWFGLNWTYSPFNNGTKSAFGLGFFTPQVGIGVSYTPSWLIINKK